MPWLISCKRTQWVTCATRKAKRSIISWVSAQTQYKWRHDSVAMALHWELPSQYGFNRSGKWFEHTPESVLDTNEAKILWDFAIQTDQNLSHNRPDIVMIDKKTNGCHLVDVACPVDKAVFVGRSVRKRRNILTWARFLESVITLLQG